MQLTPDLEKRLRELVTVFLDINQHINLSALRTEEACWIGNVLDSLAYIELASGPSSQPSPAGRRSNLESFFDLGTGGGFPLLPLAIALPEAHFTGLDAVGKKVKAVTGIAEKLGLKNVKCIAERSEVLGKLPAHREKYDVVTSRAVAELRVLLEWCSPFVKIGGTVVVWKSLHIDEELKVCERAQRECGLELETQHRYTLPGDFGERQLLVFRKMKNLASVYPRGVGMAKQNPL